MSSTSSTAGTLPLASRDAPGIGAVAWLKENLFATWLSTAVTLVLGYVIVRVAVAFGAWAIFGAVWSVPYAPNGMAQTGVCQAAKGNGACWAIVADKYRLILFGRYPYDE